MLILICLAGFGQMSMDEIKESEPSQRFGVTQEWQEKTSMKYDTMGYDYFDEEPLLQELLIEPIEIKYL